jgi:2-polyprenyl-6-methoxyphenol hydroxylase-like FAD-dependent oxidoreductase
MLALFEDGTTARGDFLVGADGVHSRVRQVIFPSTPGPSYLGVVGVGGFVTPSVIVAIDVADRRSLNFTVGRAGQFGYCNIGQNEDRWMWWCHLPQDKELTSAELAVVSNEELRKKLLEPMGDGMSRSGLFWPTQLPSSKQTFMRSHASRRGTRIGWFLSAMPHMP